MGCALTSSYLPTWITRSQCDLNHAVDKLALAVRVRFARRRLRRVDQRSQMFLEGDVFPRDVAMLAQKITEGQRASFFVSAGLNDVNVMRVRPFTWSMKERTHGVIQVWHMNIAERGERVCVAMDRLQLFHGNLNVNDGLRLQPRNRRRAVVVDAISEFPEGARNAISFRLEFQNPARIVRRDLQSLDHDCPVIGLRSLRPSLCEQRQR